MQESLIKSLRAPFLLFLLSTCVVSLAGAEGRIYFNKDCTKYNFGLSCIFGVKPKPKKVVVPPPPKRTNYIKDEVVLLYPSDSNINIKDITKKYNLKPTEKVILSSVKTGMVVAKTQGQDSLDLSKIINKKEKKVTSSSNNTFKPAITSYREAYSLQETGVNLVHETTKGKGITICMVDTPVDIFHPSLSDALIETLDIVDYDPQDADTMLHGTSVAGVLVSQNKHIGIAPKAKLFAIGAFNTTKKRPYVLQGSSSDIAKAIDSCIRHKADVINLSFTGGRDALIKKVIDKAINKGIIVVAAGGNGGHWGSTIYPALIPGVLATTAVDENKQLYKMADKGQFIDYSAPGVNILTIAPNGKYKVASGTSLASAHLSGISALLLSQGQRNNLIDKTLTETATDLGKPGRDQEFGEGLISASRALAIIKMNK